MIVAGRRREKMHGDDGTRRMATATVTHHHSLTKSANKESER